MAGSNVWIKCGKVLNLLPVDAANADTTVGNVTGAWIYKDSPHSSFQGRVTGSGAVAATLTIQVSNDGVNAVATVAGTIAISGTAPQSDGFLTVNAPWKYVRVVVSAVSGTITGINVLMGV